MKSSLQSGYDRERAAWQREKADLTARMNQLATTNLDENGRIKYDAETLRAENQALQERVRQFEEIQQKEQQRQEYLNMFREFGVDPNAIDTSTDEALAQTSWQAIGQRIHDLESKLNGPRTEPQPEPQTSQPPATKAPTVFTGSGQAVPPGVTFNELRKEMIEQWGRPVTDEEIFKALDRGRIDPSQLIS